MLARINVRFTSSVFERDRLTGSGARSVTRSPRPVPPTEKMLKSSVDSSTLMLAPSQGRPECQQLWVGVVPPVLACISGILPVCSTTEAVSLPILPTFPLDLEQI